MGDEPERDLEGELRDHIGQSELEDVRRLIAEGADVNAADPHGWTMLHKAAFGCVGTEDAFVQTLQILLEAGAHVNARDTWGCTPLMKAAGDDGDAARVRCLIAAGADVNAATPGGYTALMGASGLGGDASRIRCLIAAGANVHARTSDGWTALTFAVVNGDDGPQKVGALLEAGADPRVVDGEGKSLLHHARWQLEIWTSTEPTYTLSQRTRAFRTKGTADAREVIRLLETATRPR